MPRETNPKTGKSPAKDSNKEQKVLELRRRKLEELTADEIVYDCMVDLLELEAELDEYYEQDDARGKVFEDKVFRTLSTIGPQLDLLNQKTNLAPLTKKRLVRAIRRFNALRELFTEEESNDAVESEEASKVYQLKVVLSQSNPLIWRRLLIPGDYTLYGLHVLIQRAMGWKFKHGHGFDVHGEPFSEEGPDETVEDVCLDDLELRARQKFQYTYDFCDDWKHEITVEKVTEASIDEAKCTGGSGACPPEDCGGIHRYYSWVEAYSDSQHPDHEDALDWLGADFNVDLAEATSPVIRREEQVTGPLEAVSTEIYVIHRRD